MELGWIRGSVLSGAVLASMLLVAARTAAQNPGAVEGPSASAPQTTPPWAYPVAPPAAPGAAAAQAPQEDGTTKSVPGSSAAFTISQVRDAFNVADWHPGDHPAMPEVVVHGRRPDVRGCGYCHMPNGQGRPENSALAGLPAAYIVQQMADFKNDLRKTSEPRMGPPNAMIAIGKAATDEEVKAAAQYFSSFKFKPWIRVVESNTVPKTRIAGGMLAAAEPAATEPLGQRLIEMPEDLARTDLRDPRSSFVAYVPPGSIKSGEELATTGGARVVAGQIAPGKTIQCGICHGADLRGLGNVPPIAGRSPSYTVRQLYDMQQGNRKGPGAELMKAVVANLSLDDMISIAAYTASRVP
ncbi:MAG: cytochrome C-binding protein [Acidobacteria bacterium]|nr:cytochrome C-binding protein [Acidobacteriota bacterium]